MLFLCKTGIDHIETGSQVNNTSNNTRHSNNSNNRRKREDNNSNSRSNKNLDWLSTECKATARLQRILQGYIQLPFSSC
jgi:hypothetical protein